MGYLICLAVGVFIGNTVSLDDVKSAIDRLKDVFTEEKKS